MVAEERVVFGDFVEALFKDKVTRIANFIVGDRDNTPAPGTVRTTLLVGDNLVDNSVCLTYVFYTDSADVDIGELVVAGEGSIPVV